MPLLLFFSSTFGSLFAGLVAMFGRKMVVATASVAAAIALTFAFLSFVRSAINSLSATIAMPSWAEAVLWFVPLNFSVCVSVIIIVNVARAAYDFGMEKIKIINSAS